MAELEFCRTSSLSVGESTVATAATDVHLWLLLEYREPWPAKAVESAPLPPSARSTLDGWLEALPRCRPQLIRRPGLQTGPLSLYVASPTPHPETVVRFELTDYAQLSDIDLPRLAAQLHEGRPPTQGVVQDTPLMLVCTHGKRDACCAKWGQPVFERAAALEGFDVWQTTHLGGHRFAATLLVLPQGLCYGRVEPEEIDALAAAARRGEIWDLERLRGRCALSRDGMAAEYFVRKQSGRLGRVPQVEVRGEHVRVELDHTPYDVRLDWHTVDQLVLPSCGKSPKPHERVELVELRRGEASASPPHRPE